MNLFLNNIDSLNYKNTYIIKKTVGSLLSEFNKAIEKKDFSKAYFIKDLTNKVYFKIESNFLWAKRVNKVLAEMATKIKK